MDILINAQSEDPIYIQIKNQIIKAIIEGNLKNNEQLPSLRGLAKELKVSILTVNRAYTELESEGFIVGVQGSGFFVGDTQSLIVKEQYIREIENLFSQAVNLANISNLDLEDLTQLLEMIYKIEIND
ncbi:GntR family transcriptional regulator [Anaerococcus sp. mt242]|uniref:GntR family transcriptional regulator n=1 Tax=unclassified Anaerococcus TaxID=2614126 RepID=UPI001931FBB7|nr:GntR family transcriptional regulator [Anaerococcus sp. mt242]MBM0046658.1 GntR family transcriptional regulator [Anaerococcus sp. mt242]